MSNTNSKAFKLGRNATTGRFVPVETARKNPNRYVVENVPKPGRGDTSRGKRK